jgi:DNA-binding SARP family transcriptional activator
LAYLLINPRESSRETIANALWPDSEPENGRQNLRQILLYLREVLGPSHHSVLDATRQTVALNMSAVRSDLDPFLRPSGKAEDSLKALTRHREIVASYLGPLLPNVQDEWLAQSRAQFSRTYFDSLVFLSQEALAFDLVEALRLAETAVREEPYEDSARAAKILALKRLGREAAAQREFVLYATFLNEQLSLKPGRLVTSALKDEAPSSSPNLVRDRSDAAAATIEETLAFLRKEGMLREASELALALVPFWIRRGAPNQGQDLLLSTFAAADRKAGSVEKLSLARLAFARGDCGAARKQAEEVLQTTNSELSIAESALVLARLDLREMKPHRATSQAIRALRIARKSKNQALEIECRLLMTTAIFYKDEYRKVIPLANRVIRMADEVGDHLSRKSAFVYLAYAHHRLGEKERAEQIMETLVDELSPATSIVATQILCSTSRLMEDLGYVDRAAEMYRLCVAECKRLSNPFTLCVAQTYLGDLQAVMGCYEESLNLHLAVLQIRRDFDQNLGIATSLRGIGKALLGMKRPDEAVAALQESAQRFRDDDATSGHASSQLLLAEAEAKRKNFPLALRLGEAALESLRGLGPTARLSIGPSGAYILERGEELVKFLRERAYSKPITHPSYPPDR